MEPPAAQSELKTVWADLHLHTVASACAEIEMIPPLIARRAHELGLGLLAVTDHHTVDNVVAVQRAAAEYDIRVLPGMEVQTREEAHLVCLFADMERALAWQEVVYAHLPEQRNPEEVFGAQYVVDETGDYIQSNERLLQASLALSVDEVVAGVRALGGLPIAAHVDRPSFSLLASLGFVPPGLRLAAIEVSRRCDADALLRQHPGLKAWPLVRGGDAHRLEEMRRSLRLQVKARILDELTLALAGAQGRSVALA
ncbi:MAG: PHP domain-containing protein [Anaerolineae bacterium]|jgi:PHP family Zn ribbon phosphoesterase